MLFDGSGGAARGKPAENDAPGLSDLDCLSGFADLPGLAGPCLKRLL